MSRLALICGVPGSGKSYFGRWLEQNRGVVVVDVDHGGIDRAGLRNEWNEFRDRHDPMPTLAALAQRAQPCALVWGFPVRSLDYARALLRPGVLSPWWFSGDRSWTRRYFSERGDALPTAFEEQYDAIVRAWPQIAALFGAGVIETVAPDGARASCESLYARIFG